MCYFDCVLFMNIFSAPRHILPNFILILLFYLYITLLKIQILKWNLQCDLRLCLEWRSKYHHDKKHLNVVIHENMLFRFLQDKSWTSNNIILWHFCENVCSLTYLWMLYKTLSFLKLLRQLNNSYWTDFKNSKV